MVFSRCAISTKSVRSFEPGPTALFDLPWIPLPRDLLPVSSLDRLGRDMGGLILVSLTYLTEVRTRSPTKCRADLCAERNALAEAGRRNAEVLQAMGMGGRTGAAWAPQQQRNT